MPLLAIELNDCGIVAVQGSEVVLNSPGYAVLADGELTVGKAAAERAFLLPSHASSRFWDALSTSPLPSTLDVGRTYADLAYAHLERIWQAVRDRCDRVVLVVPTFYSRTQLELLLGITQAMNMPVVGLVDVAVAATPPTSGWQTALYLDLHLHRASFARLALQPEIARTACDVSQEVGLTAIEKAWVSALARRFVRETRFDPRHTGRTEQALHDALPGLLKTLQAQATATATLSYGTRTFSVTMHRDEFAEAAAESYRRIRSLVTPHLDEPGPVGLLLSSRLAGLPGLREQISSLGASEIRVLKPGAAAQGALERCETILQTQDRLSLVLRLPGAAGAASSQNPSSPPPTPQDRPIPTHILHQGVAHPLGDRPFALGRELVPGLPGLQIASQSAGISRNHCTLVLRSDCLLLEDHSTYGTYVNGERVRGTRPLSAGDRIRLGTPGEDLQVIVLAES